MYSVTKCSNTAHIVRSKFKAFRATLQNIKRTLCIGVGFISFI